MKKLIILDRDGVINYDSDNYIKTLDEFIFIPKSIEAICHLNKLGYKIAIATNQSGIFRQFYNQDTLNSMHQKLLTAVSQCGGQIEQIAYCPHGPKQSCACRKPKSGMLKNILSNLKLTADDAIMVGDSIKDLQAAQNIYMDSILVKTGKGQGSAEQIKIDPTILQKPVAIFDNLYSYATSLTSN